MKHIPDFMYKYLESSIDSALVRARPIPDSSIKKELIASLEKSLALAVYLRKKNNEIGDQK